MSCLDVLLPSRFAHPLTRVGPQQQQRQPQQQSIELETVMIIDGDLLQNLVPLRALCASVGAVSLPLRLLIRYGGWILDVKAIS